MTAIPAAAAAAIPAAAAAATPITKYELYIYLSDTPHLDQDQDQDHEWRDKYKAKVKQHNDKIINGYQQQQTPDSGFDLFMPVHGDHYGYGNDILMTNTKPNPQSADSGEIGGGGIDGARGLNLGVRCCLRENMIQTISVPMLSDTASTTSSSAESASADPCIITHTIAQIPRGFYLYPRSSISKTRMRLANSVGIIDAGYRGDVIAAVDTIGVFGSTDIWTIWKETLSPIRKYDRYFQLCSPDLSPFIVHIVDTESELGSPTERGAGGFGSTGV